MKPNIGIWICVLLGWLLGSVSLGILLAIIGALMFAPKRKEVVTWIRK